MVNPYYTLLDHSLMKTGRLFILTKKLKRNGSEGIFLPVTAFALTLTLRPNSNLSQTSHCDIKGLSVSEVMRIENMITQAQFY